MLRVQLVFLTASARLFMPATQPVQPERQASQPVPQLVTQPLRATFSAEQVFAAEFRQGASARTSSSFACLAGGLSLLMFGLYSVKKASLAGLGGADAISSLANNFRESKKRASLPSRRHTEEERDAPLNGEVLEISVLLGNEHTETKILLNGLRIRFRGDPVTSSELPGQSRALEKISDPWFISMDGKTDVAVEGGAWCLEPVSWGRLANGAGIGKYCFWFWVDLKVPVVKNGFGIPEGSRLFFAINLLEKAELPNLFADIQKLEAKIASFKEMGHQKATSFGRWIAFVKRYDEWTTYEAQLSTVAMGVPSSSDKLTEFGRFCVRKNKTGVVSLIQGKEVGHAGSFTIKSEVGRENFQTPPLTKEDISI